MKRILKTLFIIILSVVSISFVYTYGYRLVFYYLHNRAIEGEEQVDFAIYAKGITLVNENNKVTLFFIPSSEELASSELYGRWLDKLHKEQSVNIIVPPFDLDGVVPYLSSENESVTRRLVITEYLYRLYSNQMGRNHKIAILSTGDGSLAALEIGKTHSTMDKIILISPVHNSPVLRSGSIFHKMEGTILSRYYMPWLIRSFSKNRVGSYDILNDNLNEQFHDLYGQYYPKYLNLKYSRKLRTTTDSVMGSIEEVKGNRIFIIYGDDDLSYSLEGFERLGDQLQKGGSEVSIMRIPQSGRMVLFDNGRERIYDLISILLQ